jgi:three-Cys-motif partner protein
MLVVGCAMLPDDAMKKWDDYPAHTKAKHDILIRYMGAWMSILGGGARAAGFPAHLVIVDAFAGRGRYSTDDLGSPLLLRGIAGDVIARRRADDVELFFIESNPSNCAALTSELAATAPPSGVREVQPIQGAFEDAAPDIVESIQRSGRSSFWFIDPFGYSGLPLRLIQRILDLQRSEVLVTLMVRDMNRFLDDSSHLTAIARILDLRGDSLAATVAEVKRAPDRMQALCTLYTRQLESPQGPRRRYVKAVRIARDSASDTIYYLVHATCHLRGKREMKKAMRVALRGMNAFFGANHPSSNTDQLGMFGTNETVVNYSNLRTLLQSQFAGQRIEYDRLLDGTAASHDFDDVIDSDIKRALEELADRGVIQRFRRGVPSKYKLRDGDVLQFPPA